MGMLLHRHNIEVEQVVEKSPVSTPKKDVPKKEKSLTKKDLFGASKQKLIEIAKENGIEIDEEAKAQDIKKTITDKLGL